jgi:hypothetical protein
VAALLPVLAGGGCGGGPGTPPDISGAPKQAADTVDALGRAIARRHFREVCDKLLTSQARELAGGTDCAPLLRRAAAGLRSPRIRITGIDLTGKTARIKVITTAVGQPPIADTLELVRVGRRYRVSALVR